MRDITTKYHPDNRKHRCQLADEPKIQSSRIFVDKKLAVTVITDCRTTSGQIFRTKLGFKQCDVILTKEQPLLTKIMSSFEGKHWKTRYSV